MTQYYAETKQLYHRNSFIINSLVIQLYSNLGKHHYSINQSINQSTNL